MLRESLQKAKLCWYRFRWVMESRSAIVKCLMSSIALSEKQVRLSLLWAPEGFDLSRSIDSWCFWPLRVRSCTVFVLLKGLDLVFNSAKNEGWETSVRRWKTEVFFTPEGLASSCRWRQGSQQQERFIGVCVDKALRPGAHGTATLQALYRIHARPSFGSFATCRNILNFSPP